ncbi:MAG: 2'-5' RNA ligase family protein [Actinomycetota bacterium]|nr:2'-5' RNA ligase family protein [Actinomycetota bacterium]
MVDAPTESAVLVPIPEVEPLVARHRADLDPSSRWGVPAHVTVLYPFVAPREITTATISVLAEVTASVPAFEFEFRRTRRFGREVLWLAPEPAEPFRALTAAVSSAFPQHPPYGGVFDDVIPHLTIGDSPPDGTSALDRAEHDVRAHLPVTATVREVWLMAGDRTPQSWHRLARLPLSGS